MKRVLVILVTYNGMRWLERCLSSIPAWADVYVYDNASTDGSAAFVRRHCPRAVLVEGSRNLGFSRPNNLGFEYARTHGYDYVYLLNEDAWLEAGALETMVSFSLEHPEYGVLSPLQMTDGYRALDSQFAKCYRGCVEVRRVMAAHWLVPVRALEFAGPFEEELFPHWGQDDEWCQRLHFLGLKAGVVPQARAVHDRAYRQEPLDKLVRRNYYTGCLVRLCNPARSLWACFLFFVVPFTLVKAVKYRSMLPFKFFRRILEDLPRVKAHRSCVRMRAQNAR